MIINVVPIKRIRSGVETLSYLAPESIQADLKIGCLVVVPIRGKEVVSIVWQINLLTKSSNLKYRLKTVLGLISKNPFLTEKQLSFFQWLSDYYLTSKPTVLSLAIPDSFSKPNLKTALMPKKALSFSEPQELVLIPYQPYPFFPAKNLGNQSDEIVSYNSQLTESEKLKIWKQVSSGEKITVFGTILPLFLPFQNLTKITLFEPEEDLYKYEQTPKINSKEAVHQLAEIHQAELELRSFTPYLPSNFSAKPIKVLGRLPKTKIIDLTNEQRLINYQSELWLKSRLDHGRKIIIFFPKADLVKNQIRFGFQSLAVTLKMLLPKTQVCLINSQTDFENVNWRDCALIVGGKKLLYLPKIIEADLFLPSLDYWLSQSLFQPEKLIAQINKLSLFSQEIGWQTKKLDDPFFSAWQKNQIFQYLTNFYQPKEKRQSFPFGIWIKLTFNADSEKTGEKETTDFSQTLEAEFPKSLTVFGPNQSFSNRAKKGFNFNLLIKVNQEKIELDLREKFLKLPSSWTIDPHPVSLL